MGLDCTYQGIPSDSPIISTAYSDPTFAENIFYSVVAHSSSLESSHYFNEIEYAPVRELFKLNPYVKCWNYSPSSRMQQALMYCLDPKTFVGSNSFEELSSTFGYAFVRGKSRFSPNLNSGEMQLVRYSLPEFVNECAVYAERTTYESLLANFNAKAMADLHIYKINEFSKFEYIYEYFVGLRNLYIELATYGNASIFITEQ